MSATSLREWLDEHAGRYVTNHIGCGCSSMVERQLPKLHTRVQFPSPAPILKQLSKGLVLRLALQLLFSFLFSTGPAHPRHVAIPRSTSGGIAGYVVEPQCWFDGVLQEWSRHAQEPRHNLKRTPSNLGK